MWWWALRFLGALAGAGVAAAIAAAADGKTWWPVAGAFLGAVGTSFAPSLLERWRTRRIAHATAARAAELGPDSAPALLLRHSEAVVPFTGRERELAELLAWCSDPDAGRLRLLVGPGGVGKSRLAAELYERLDRSWGYLEIADEAEADALSRLREVSGGRLLVVVDYAETRTGLAGLLNEAAADEGSRLRVLLLARSAGEWWRQLGGQSARVRRMVSQAGEGMELAEQVAGGLSDQEVVMRAVPHFARALGAEVPEGMEVELGRGPHRVLDLHAVALVAVLRSMPHGSGAGPARVGAEDVLEELLGHERRFWLRTAQARGFTSGTDGLSTAALEQTVAAGTLLGARSRAQAAEVVGRVPDGTASVAVADWLRELYPPGTADDREWLGRLRPDRLAELHVTRQFSGSPELLEACLEGLDAHQGRRALVMLARAAHELDEAGEILQRLLPRVAGEVGGLVAPRETLVALYEALPFPSAVLAEAQALLAKRLLISVPDGDDGERARWLTAFGQHVSRLGRPAEALRATQEAVDIYRELAGHYPDRYRPDLADSLDNLGNRLSGLGLLVEALRAAQEAVDIRRELAGHYPDHFHPGLADSLDNLGNHLWETGRPAEAVRAALEAVDIRRELAGRYPDRYRPGLANSLSNLGNHLRATGLLTEALNVTREAVDIRRELAACYPDRYRPDLAMSLNNLGVFLSEMGLLAEALNVTREAVDIYRELAGHYPDRYRPDLAMSLNNLGIRLSETGLLAEALNVTREAVDIRRGLAECYPDRYRPGLASSLNNLGNHLSEAGLLAEALDAAREAVDIRRGLAERYPDRYRLDLAMSLNNLGVFLAEKGLKAEALRAAQEADDIHREPAARHPDSPTP
ncbi:Tetratricopeptide repeat-containing protein [Sinosporangium album]|uniref:Tetratricopeptide repeat-containing protein n=1 Tax=Sinosporangium album TaxID=504805 RepID=A0A1G8GW31_9ACTN|nr:tetratricopeptide repeat protein [Sinosporangium album]SDH98604.1 Tetratricopeptide repeat-containing protein [Sinosporangium album]